MPGTLTKQKLCRCVSLENVHLGGMPWFLRINTTSPAQNHAKQPRNTFSSCQQVSAGVSTHCTAVPVPVRGNHLSMQGSSSPCKNGPAAHPVAFMPNKRYSFWQEAMQEPWTTNPFALKRTDSDQRWLDAEGTAVQSSSQQALLLPLTRTASTSAPTIYVPSPGVFALALSVAAGAFVGLLWQQAIAAATATAPTVELHQPHAISPAALNPTKSARSRSCHRRRASRAYPPHKAPPPDSYEPGDDRESGSTLLHQEVTLSAAAPAVSGSSSSDSSPIITPVLPSGVVPILASGAAGSVHRCSVVRSSTASHRGAVRGSLKGPPGGGIRRRRQTVTGTIVFGNIDVQLQPVEVLHGPDGGRVRTLMWHAPPPPDALRKGGLRRLT